MRIFYDKYEGLWNNEKTEKCKECKHLLDMDKFGSMCRLDKTCKNGEMQEVDNGTVIQSI